MKFATVLCIGLLAALLGCSRADQDKARQKANAARNKTATALRKLGTEAEANASKLNEKLTKSLDGQAGREAGGTSSAQEKLKHAGAVARAEGRQAGAKLNYAALLTKVKAKVASDVGLATIANVDVEVDGAVVTLSGSISSEGQKRQAEHAASSVDGVTRVVNNLTVQP